MGKAFICDISGQQCVGEPVKVIPIAAGKFKVELRVYRKQDSTTFVEADLGPDAVAKLAAAVKNALPAEEPAKEEKPKAK